MNILVLLSIGELSIEEMEQDDVVEALGKGQSLLAHSRTIPPSPLTDGIVRNALTDRYNQLNPEAYIPHGQRAGGPNNNATVVLDKVAIARAIQGYSKVNGAVTGAATPPRPITNRAINQLATLLSPERVSKNIIDTIFDDQGEGVPIPNPAHQGEGVPIPNPDDQGEGVPIPNPDHQGEGVPIPNPTHQGEGVRNPDHQGEGDSD